MSLDAISAKNQMNEIARMAYGSGIFEGTSGGKGNIGLITGADGQARAIKFNTHFYERGGAATEDQIKSSNALRAQLLTIAESLNSGVMADLRAKLGLKDGEDATSCKTLLTRQVVASALKMIDKNAMSDAMKDVNASSLKSLGGTKFEEARMHTDYGISSTTLKKCGMSAADFEEAINMVASNAKLSNEKKQLVGRMTASYMTAIAEEGRTGQLDASGKQKTTLPSKSEIKSQIANGTFTGTYMGLIKADKVSARSPAFRSAEKLLGSGAMAVMNGLSDDECVDAAYLLGKIGTGPRSSMPGDNQVSGFALKSLMENRESLMAMHRKEGNLSVGTIWKEIAGKEMPEGKNNTATDFSRAVQQKFFDKLVNVEKNPKAIEKWGSGENADYSQFEAQGLMVIMLAVENFGVPLDQATKLALGQEVKDIKVCLGSSAYETSSTYFKTEPAEKLLDQIYSDMCRARGNSPFHVSDGKTTISIIHTKEQSSEMAKTQAEDLFKSLSKLIGGGDEIKDPLPPQLKTMVILSAQAGNNFLSLSGLAAAQLDHHPTEKSFTLQNDGSVLFTASGEVKASGEEVGTMHSATYRINTDGTSSLLEYKRAAAA